MAVADAMFIFEVVVEHVKSLVDTTNLVIRSDFADIFSLELKDPKQMNIVIPDPPPLPPDPPGKKGKKKPPKPKKGKKGKEPPPPPEPVIQAGQSVLFTSSAEVLIKCMNKFPLEVSLWNKEDNLVFIGSNMIPWDPIFIKYLEAVYNHQDPLPVTVNDEYNVFEEETAKLMVKIGLQVKLSHLGEKVTTAFRTLSEDPAVRKCLYTGINSKVTSYICNMKTTDEDFEENCNKIENNYIKDRQKPVLTDFKNAQGGNESLFNEGDYCCMNNADKPPDSIYKSPQTLPDIDFIVDYIRKVVMSCNDNMRMLTPRPTIRPKVRATDIDRLCYCKETHWPAGDLAQRFKNEVQTGPCPVCINAGKRPEGSRGANFDIANIRGPCGRHDCKVARAMRQYIENLVDEDATEINIDEIIGPCGSTLCTLAERVQEFLRHEGPFAESRTIEGLQTQCACIQQMQEALRKRKSCTSVCSKDCQSAESDDTICGGKGCPFPGPSKPQIYDVYYFTVEYNTPPSSNARSQATSPMTSKTSSKTPSKAPTTKSSVTSIASSKSSKFQHCAKECPSMKAAEITTCSKDICAPAANKLDELKCPDKPCSTTGPPSPADSDIVIDFKDIHNPCCVKTCNIADTVKTYIAEGVESKNKRSNKEDSCYCDCVCTFKFSKKTTYCAVCGGYEALGDDMDTQPDHARPHPCPVYHKLYDQKVLKTPNPWPDEEKKPADNVSVKSSKSAASKPTRSASVHAAKVIKKDEDKKPPKDLSGEKVKKMAVPQEKKKKIENVAQGETTAVVEKKPEPKYPYPLVPKNMGWNWTADDIPGLKPRPKWKPGAANKILVRRYRAMREGLDIIAKKKRALLNKKKKIEMKPTLVVTKHDGEFTVQMEVFKKYSKERLCFQYPYDEKPPITYTIGKTEEEKRKIQKQRDRRERRETRRKSRLLQSTFRDKCQEICVKAYNQAIGLLPLPNPNDPNCPCYTDAVPIPSPPIDSCSCSEEGTISSSDTDGDSWIVEFTPPMARWDPKAKHPPVLVDNETQYTYLDYKVKVLDKQGVQVPRYFKGPDGKEECSDLGGFWGPGHVWMEINKDGYIGPDNRWIPMNFIGPDGMFYSAEEGFFVDNSGRTLKLGIDGYIDKDGKWAWYSKGQKSFVKPKAAVTPKGRANTPPAPQANNAKKKDEGANAKRVNTTKSEVAASTKASCSKNTSNVKSGSPGSKSTKKPVVMSFSTNFENNGRFTRMTAARPVRAGAAEWKKIARYREIMQGLKMYPDIGDLQLPSKSTRACNTPRKKLSPFTPRPKWKPGAANKILVRRYRAMREGLDIIAKKKRALLNKKKKIEMKPTLVVTKHDGEFTVQMEVFKKYSKERLCFQYPYDEKPPITYTIGKTEEEKRKIQKQRDRRERRETRRKSRLLQSTFRDKCQEICVKAYNQAIGLLPLPNPNDPNCPCYTDAVPIPSPPIDSCSCSEEGTISSSDTDGDSWIVEFTPPMARWDPKAKHPPVLVDNETQYTYLDYKVKVLDKQGVQVPRYFKGPDGKEECSDLGGFWGPGHVWMEINKDGYIGPDNRWIPMNFIGPDGMFYSAEEGFFVDNSGRTLKLGIDGYIDKDGKWAWYSKGQKSFVKPKAAVTPKGRANTPPAPQANNAKKKDEGANAKRVNTTKSEVAASTKASCSKNTSNVKSGSPGSKSTKKPVVMSFSTNFENNGRFTRMTAARPVRAGAAEWKKIARYREIMQGLKMYPDIGDLQLPSKSTRACNTPRKKLSPFTVGYPGGLEPICSFINKPCSTISQSQSGSCLKNVVLPDETCY